MSTPANTAPEGNQDQPDSHVSLIAQDPPSPQSGTIQVTHPAPPDDSEMFVVLVGLVFLIVVLITALISTASKNELRRKP